VKDPYQKVNPGERLVVPAVAWNRMLDLVKASGRTGGELGSLQPAQNTVWIRNDAGVDVPQFGVLGISDVVVNPRQSESHAREFARRPALAGVKPNTSDHADRFVVCLEPISATKIGMAAVGGVFACKVQYASSSHRYATVNNMDHTKLVTAKCGLVQLLWVDGGTDEVRWAVGCM
jgi:hypothetical protein